MNLLFLAGAGMALGLAVAVGGCSRKPTVLEPEAANGPSASAVVEFTEEPPALPPMPTSAGNPGDAAPAGADMWITADLAGELDGVRFRLPAGAEVEVVERSGDRATIVAQGQEWEVPVAVLSGSKPDPAAPGVFTGAMEPRLLRIEKGQTLSPKAMMSRREAGLRDQADQARSASEGLARSGGDPAEIQRFREQALTLERAAEGARLQGLGMDPAPASRPPDGPQSP